MWTDTHCHLDAREFDADRTDAVARARAAGVTQIVLPAVAASNVAAVRQLAHAHALSYAIGIHPLCVAEVGGGDIDAIEALLDAHRDDPRLVAVGEIGIDHFVPGLPERQTEVCAAQIRLAREHDLPVILHTRRAVDGVLKLLRRTPVCGGIAHAFNGSDQQAHILVDLGLKLGFGGAMTFERALQIRRLAQSLPIESIVLETDAPDIAPQWRYRSAAERDGGPQARNESAELPRIGAVLAQLRDMSPHEVAAITSANARAALPRLAALDAMATPGRADLPNAGARA